MVASKIGRIACSRCMFRGSFTPHGAIGAVRDLIRKKVISMEDAMEARKLVDFPGGLELHIGVCCMSACECTNSGDQSVPALGMLGCDT